MLSLRKSFFLRAVMAAGLLTTMVAAPSLAAQSGPKQIADQTQPTRDVRLDDAGSLHVRLVDQQGKGIGNLKIAIRSSAGAEIAAVTDAQGNAEFSSVKPGLYMVPTGTGVQTLRVWTPTQAPPKAIDSVAVVVDETVVRGQAVPFYGDGNGDGDGGGFDLNTALFLTVGGLATYSFVRVLELDDENDSLRAQINSLTPASP